jgi:uncharacterized protein
MPAEPTIDYETIAQDAMRGVVRTVLTQAAKQGLPGDHHFYISFDTGASGVVLSKRLKDKYPHEMTVVLQHRFWDLVVHDDSFEVKLTFDGIPERLVVPFASIRVFFDPSVRYGLQFESADLEPESGEPMDQRFSKRSGSNGSRAQLRSTAPKKPRVPRKSKSDKTAKTQPEAQNATENENEAEKRAKDTDSAPAGTTRLPTSRTAGEKSSDDLPPADRPRQDNGGAEIVSLDAFRKK